MVEKSTSTNETNISYEYLPCKHLTKLFTNHYHSIINPQIKPIFNQFGMKQNLKSFSECEKYIQFKLSRLSSVETSNTFYENKYSVNPNTTNAVEGCIFQLEFNENGKYMAASNHHGTVEIWNLATKKLRNSLEIHKEIVTGIELFSYPGYCSVFSNKDKSNFESLDLDPFEDYELENLFILSGSLDKTIKLSKNMKVLHEFNQHHDWIKSLTISNDKTSFLSGCISSIIKVWDLNTRQVKLSIKAQPLENTTNLNTVNTLKFFNENQNLFISAFRDGLVKIFDTRLKISEDHFFTSKPTLEFKAHDNKLNTIKLSKNDNFGLSCGRDNCGRLWDMRNLPNDVKVVDKSKVLNTYTGHKCSGFNIEFSFFGKEEYCITGSEDGNIYVYDILSTELIKLYETKERCINIVKPVPNLYSNYSFVYSGLEHLHLHFCEEKGIKKYDKKNFIGGKSSSKEENSQQELIEELMAENGDMILKLIHQNNLNISTNMNDFTILETILNNDDPINRKILEEINKKMIESLLKGPQKKKKLAIKEVKNSNIYLNCSNCENISYKDFFNSNVNLNDINFNEKLNFKSKEDLFTLSNTTNLVLLIK